MEYRITLNPSQMAVAAQINTLLRENGILSQLSSVSANVSLPIAARPAPIAQPLTPVTPPMSLTSSFVYVDFEPGY